MDKALTVTVPIVLKGEAKGVKQQGGIVDFVNREIEIEVLPGDIPENIVVDISELMLNQGVRVRDLHTEGVKWSPLSDADMMIVHVVTLKVEEEAPAAEAAARAGRGSGARGHQEGQDRQGEGRVARATGETPCELSSDEADRRARQPRAKVRRHQAQRRLRRHRRAGRAAWGQLGVGAGRRVDGTMARRWCAAGQAADVHEPQRPRRRRAAALLQDRAAGPAGRR